jgi:hypothetical protein
LSNATVSVGEIRFPVWFVEGALAYQEAYQNLGRQFFVAMLELRTGLFVYGFLRMSWLRI